MLGGWISDLGLAVESSVIRNLGRTVGHGRGSLNCWIRFCFFCLAVLVKLPNVLEEAWISFLLSSSTCPKLPNILEEA